jgi:hypothetical protein
MCALSKRRGVFGFLMAVHILNYRLNLNRHAREGGHLRFAARKQRFLLSRE